MVPLKKITKARTSQELRRLIADDTDRGWSVGSEVKYLPEFARSYQVLMIFNTESEEA